MSRKHGPWVVRSSEVRFANDFLELVEDEVINPDGSAGRYATARLKSGVCILPIDDDGFVYLVKQFRYAVGRESLEVVAGGLEGDDALEGAKRELKEELGIEAGEWTELGSIDMDTSIVSGPASLYIARRLTFGEPEREGTEVMKPEKVTLPEAVKAVTDGRIAHAMSAVLILKWNELNRSGGPQQ